MSWPDGMFTGRHSFLKGAKHQVLAVSISNVLQARDRVVDLGVKIFQAFFKKSPDSLRLFNFKEANSASPELRKHALKTFVAFSDVVDGLDNADKTMQIFEHLVRYVSSVFRLFKCG
jgi:hypothetical protein